MKPSLFIFGSAVLLATSFASAQDLSKPGKEPFRRIDSKPKPAEVSVVLEDVADKPLAPSNAEPKIDSPLAPSKPLAPTPAPEKTTPPETPQEPVLVTGKPPEHAEVVTGTPKSSPDATELEKGVSVHVEKIQGGNGKIDPQKVKLSFPFPPKPLATAPAGWTFDTSGNVPPFFKDAELAPGAKITLKIKPHVLVPIADGKDTFSVNEPGYDPTLGLNQKGTVGTILATSIAQLDDDSMQLGDAIDRLQQLLSSLPAPEVEPAPPVATPIKDPGLPKKPR